MAALEDPLLGNQPVTMKLGDLGKLAHALKE
jgi:hypothetical protein